jgi:hypothetical protein
VGIHAVSYYDEPDQHELVDIDYQCSYICMMDTLTEAGVDTEGGLAGDVNLSEGGSISWGRFPGGEETSSDTYCSSCETLLWRGLESKVDD